MYITTGQHTQHTQLTTTTCSGCNGRHHHILYLITFDILLEKRCKANKHRYFQRFCECCVNYVLLVTAFTTILVGSQSTKIIRRRTSDLSDIPRRACFYLRLCATDSLLQKIELRIRHLKKLLEKHLSLIGKLRILDIRHLCQDIRDCCFSGRDIKDLQK